MRTPSPGGPSAPLGARRHRSELLATLRGDPGRRPRIDPGLSGGLRAWLEDGLAPLVGDRPAGAVPMIVRPYDVWRARRPAADPPPTPGAASAVADHRQRRLNRQRLALARALFGHRLTVGRFSANSWDDALDALDAQGQPDDQPGPAAGGIDRRHRPILQTEVRHQVAVLERSWSRLPSGWLPRVNERIQVPLAGGRVVLDDVVDLMVGDPATHASVCLVQLRLQPAQDWHRQDLHATALFETLRSGAPPFRVASFSVADGSLTAEDVTDDLLAGAVEGVIDAVAAGAAQLTAGVGR